MEKKISLAKSAEEEKRNNNKEYKYSGGVTNKLLEKYMPSKRLGTIRGAKEEANENIAA